MHTLTKATLVIILVLALVPVLPVAAQAADEPAPCDGETVSGTVVDVDEDQGVVTVDTGDGLCTVKLDGDYDHPIVALLGLYFGDVSAGDLAEALKNTQGCAVYDADTDSWTWADCNAEGAEPVAVTGENEDGTFTFTVNGEEVTGTLYFEDPATSGKLSEALETLIADWNLEDGAITQPGDEIAAYHEDGMGFGVLVKLYAMAAESQEACDASDDESCVVITVEELVDALQSGMGMGQLFKEYGKPSMVGVGHVRKNLRSDYAGKPDKADKPDKPDNTDELDKTNKPDKTGKPDKADKPDKTSPPDHAGPKPKPKKK